MKRVRGGGCGRGSQDELRVGEAAARSGRRLLHALERERGVPRHVSERCLEKSERVLAALARRRVIIPADRKRTCRPLRMVAAERQRLAEAPAHVQDTRDEPRCLRWLAAVYRALERRFCLLHVT